MSKTREITFEEFWKKYPLHKSKGPAQRAWDRLSAKDQRAAFAGIDRYREYCLNAGIAFKYAQGWLNDRRWTDEYEEDVPLVRQPVPAEQPLSAEMETW